METTDPVLSNPPDTAKPTAAEKAATEIRGLMGAKQLSVPDLAKKLNVSRDTAARRLSGDGYLTLNELEEIAGWLDVPILRIIAPAPGVSYSE